MKCPVCRSSQLTHTRYEDVPVRTCKSCEGYLVQKKRVGNIKNSRQKSDEEVIAELSSPNAVDTIRAINCPSCTGSMTKNPMPVGTQRYFVDECRKCELVWFDAGELAKLQLHYEGSEQGNEMLQFQKRLANMNEAELSEYEQLIAKCPASQSMKLDDMAILGYLLFKGSRRL